MRIRRSQYNTTPAKMEEEIEMTDQSMAADLHELIKHAQQKHSSMLPLTRQERVG